MRLENRTKDVKCSKPAAASGPGRRPSIEGLAWNGVLTQPFSQHLASGRERPWDYERREHLAKDGVPIISGILHREKKRGAIVRTLLGFTIVLVR